MEVRVREARMRPRKGKVGKVRVRKEKLED